MDPYLFLRYGTYFTQQLTSLYNYQNTYNFNQHTSNLRFVSTGNYNYGRWQEYSLPKPSRSSSTSFTNPLTSFKEWLHTGPGGTIGGP